MATEAAYSVRAPGGPPRALAPPSGFEVSGERVDAEGDESEAGETGGRLGLGHEEIPGRTSLPRT